ncbi:MAG: hypothetical protein IJ593_07540, partial [Lachnospiraceae bacterium]|nr:hypothetical protein [Lachnospiraceae bacterium]
NFDGSLGYNLVFSRASDSYLMKGIEGHKIASGSVISISALAEEVKVFEYWNDTYIERFNEKNYYVTQEIFRSDKPYDTVSRKAMVYKTGTYEKVALKWGYDYATIQFKKDATEFVVATQYVAKRVETFVDRVFLPESQFRVETQIWSAPAVYNENVEVEWYWGRDDRKRFNIKVTKDTIVYLASHKHRLCGTLASDSCVHFDKASHSVVNFALIMNENDITRSLSQRRWALFNDVRITRNLTLLDGSAICLNGHTLYIDEGVDITVAGDRTFTICDCQAETGHGAISETNPTSVGGATDLLRVTQGQLNLYNVRFATISFFSTSNIETIIHLGANGKLHAENLTFDNITFDSNLSINPLIRPVNRMVKATVSDITIKNSHIRNTAEGILNLTAGYAIKYATISLINNETDKAVLMFKPSGNEKVEVQNINVIGNRLGTTGVKGGIIYVDNVEAEVKNGYNINSNTGNYSVVYVSGANGKLTSDGPVNANANVGLNGAVFYVDKGVLTDDGLVFNDVLVATGNSATHGAVFYIDNSKLTLPKKATIKNNNSSEGAVFYLDESTLYVPNSATKSIIEDNTAMYGTVVYANDSLVDVENKWTIENNSGINGSAIYVNNVTKNNGLSDITFKNNKGERVVYITGGHNVKLSSISFINNEVSKGVIFLSSDITVDDVLFDNNKAREDILYTAGRLNVDRLVFTNNKSSDSIINMTGTEILVNGDMVFTNNKVDNAAIKGISSGVAEIIATGSVVYKNNEGRFLYFAFGHEATFKGFL